MRGLQVGRRDGEGSLESSLWISLASLRSGLRFVSRQDAERISKERSQARPPPVTTPRGTPTRVLRGALPPAHRAMRLSKFSVSTRQTGYAIVPARLVCTSTYGVRRHYRLADN